jgi:hypothetical protein
VRTTVTIDDDVATKLKEEMRRTGSSFKQVVNEALRRDLNRPPAKGTPPFKVRARNLGLKPGYSYDNVWELIELIEGPDYK